MALVDDCSVFESFGKITSIKMPPDMMWAGRHRLVFICLAHSSDL